MRIAHDEHVAVADDAANRVAAVPRGGGFRDQLGHVQSGGNHRRDFRAGHSGVAQVTVKVGVRLVEMVADFL